MNIQCPKCHTLISSKAQYCHACGCEVQHSTSEAHVPEAPSALSELSARTVIRRVPVIREGAYAVVPLYIGLLTHVGVFFLIVTVMLSTVAFLLEGTLPTSCGFGGIINIFDVYTYIPIAILSSVTVTLLLFFLRHILQKSS
jgi:hypothetical protein